MSKSLVGVVERNFNFRGSNKLEKMKQSNRLAFVSLNLVACFQYFSTVTGEGLRGIHLKFTTYHNPPYDSLALNMDGNYTSSGSNANVMEWLSKKCNFTYSIQDPVTDQAMIAKYGFFELAVKKIGENGIDGTIAPGIVTPERAEKADFPSMLAWSEPYTIVAPKPEQESRLFAFIRPFQPTVWLYLALSVIVIVAIMSWFSFIFNHQLIKSVNHNNQLEKEKIINKVEKVSDTISYYVIYVINILTNHGIYTPYAQQSFRILAAGWLLAALVLVNSYSSIICSSLTVPAMKPPVNSFEDLANHRDVSVILNTDVILSKLILNATTGIFKRLGDQARENLKDRVQTNFPSTFKKLENGHFGYFFIESYMRYFIGQQYKKDGKCRFRMSPPLQFSSGSFTFLLKKNFSHTSTLTLGLTYLWETGLTRHWVMNLLPKAEECFDQNTKKVSTTVQKVNPIKLQDLTSAFLILGIGIGLGCFTFLLELIIKFKI